MHAIIIRFMLLLFALIISNDSFAQGKDTVVKKTPQNDTLSIYKKIRRVAYKHKFTKFIYHAVFVDQAPLKYDKKPLSDNQKKKDPNLGYKGDIIRSITVVVLDPFGYSANDTNQSLINPLQNFANKAHIVTQKRTVKNILLFKRYEKVELLKINESERLLREAQYIRDARIYLTKSKRGQDSVDITVLVHDKWSIDPIVIVTGKGGELRLRDKNIAGLGHTYEQGIHYSAVTGSELRGKYTFSNIRNTFISSDIFYFTSKNLKQVGVNFDRPFYSLMTKLAGGVSAIKSYAIYSYVDTFQLLQPIAKMDYFSSDVWIAGAYTPKMSKTSDQQGSKMVAALRYADNTFQNRPSFEIDTAYQNSNSYLYLASVGYSLRKYYKDQYIYRFGANEDVAEGLVVQLLYGYSGREYVLGKYYAGMEISRGKLYKKLGYLSGNLSVGTLHNKVERYNTTLNMGVFYFTNLSLERKWYIRQFVNYKFIKGFNKAPHETITIRSDELYGFNSGNVLGSAKMLLNFETVLYAPYNLIGFKFAPIVLVGFGMLETKYRRLMKSPVYQAYSVGVLVRNESLLNSSFEITFGMYPNLPANGGSMFKFNPVTSFTLKVRSFAISKPELVGFN